jgi:prepilin-type N-terminal cleavage/methylation domain-containing protein/prepilin-type processing-associated H-X9-DG protein
MKRGFTLIELLVVIAIIAILASILFPVFAKAREKARQTQCTSNIKQLALGIQMYSQDNGSQYPGIDGSGWVSKVAPYLGNSTEMFQCPSDANENVVSYAIAGLLIREDRSGVKESQVISPSEVGALCDANPSMAYPSSRVIGGGGQQPIESISAEPETRHSRGLVVGFVDGHAKYFQGAIDKANEGNGAIRALYHASPLGLIDNPAAGIPNNCGIAGSTTVVLGGEYVTRPILMGAGLLYAGNYYSPGFKGQYYSTARPSTGWVWGTASTAPGWMAQTAVAFDGVCVIVAKGSKIPYLPSMSNSTYVVNTALIRTLFEIGYQQNTVQVYKMPDARASTNAYIRNVIGNGSLAPFRPWGIDAVEVADDAEMVEKITNDPYGIGYCSTSVADPDRVVVLGLAGLGTDTNDAIWPRSSAKFRWVMPSRAESTWPWKRSMDVTVAGGEVGVGTLNVQAACRTGNYIKAQYAGPLFTWGYWPGNY